MMQLPDRLANTQKGTFTSPPKKKKKKWKRKENLNNKYKDQYVISILLFFMFFSFSLHQCVCEVAALYTTSIKLEL